MDAVRRARDPILDARIRRTGVCGIGAAVANAVFNAIGIRVTDFPITMGKLPPGLPAEIRP
jgi:xanthine dehydrogenase YagR molybdenum-binding subunit